MPHAIDCSWSDGICTCGNEARRLRADLADCAHSDDRDRLFRSISTTYSDASRPLLWTRVRGCLILATE